MLEPGRPKISVCIATWDGERYIHEQLTSILNQLSSTDEVIVVDDASRDSTRVLIRALGDPRISLIEHLANVGTQRSFQDALSRATGEIIFLSDQDDIWMQHKVSSALAYFKAHPELNILVSDAILIDEVGHLLSNSYYRTRGTFRAGVLANMFQCKYLGCVMVMRRRVLQVALPFPKSTNVLHDLWIGVTNAIVGGKTLYVSEPWVFYRRHGGNVTGTRKLSVWKKLRNRGSLARSIISFYLRRYARYGSMLRQICILLKLNMLE